MNPFPLIFAAFRRSRLSAILFIAVIALTVALGIAISAQERALRKGSGTAADGFDLIVSAKGSQTDALLSVVYLDPKGGGLMAPDVLARLMAEPGVEFAAPIGFGDSVKGAQVVGTTAELLDHLGGLAEGRGFASLNEAVVGAAAPFKIGEAIEIAHGDVSELDDADQVAEGASHDHAHDEDGHLHLHEPVTVVGRMKPTGTPWDRGVMVPVEYTWFVHGLALGHSTTDPAAIGPPFSSADLPGVPAVVVKPRNFAAAYDLRARYRTDEGSTAFFPAEVLVQLYGLLGDAAAIMSGLTLAAQVLVIVAILAGLLAVLDLQRQRFAVLRALGAPGSFVFLTVWLYVWLLVMAGALLGLPLGLGLAEVVSRLITAQTGVAMTPSIRLPELRLVGALIGLSLILAVIPAALIYRRPVVEALR